MSKLTGLQTFLWKFNKFYMPSNHFKKKKKKKKKKCMGKRLQIRFKIF